MAVSPPTHREPDRARPRLLLTATVLVAAAALLRVMSPESGTDAGSGPAPAPSRLTPHTTCAQPSTPGASGSRPASRWPHHPTPPVYFRPESCASAQNPPTASSRPPGGERRP